MNLNTKYQAIGKGNSFTFEGEAMFFYKLMRSQSGPSVTRRSLSDIEKRKEGRG